MLSVSAPAKVNLTLEVLRRRADGYHELRSVVSQIDICDRVDLYPSEDGLVKTVVEGDGVDVSQIGPNESNLATMAARALRKEAGIERGVSIRILKRIPLGGGLGGGSADAAAVLLGLNRVWECGLGESRLLELAAGLGCDIPALMLGGLVMMEGVGHKVRRLVENDRESVPIWMVIANPGLAVSTPEIYSRCRPPLTGAPKYVNNLVSSFFSGKVLEASRWLYNGLEAAAAEAYPQVAELLAVLRDIGSPGVLLCGSGASVMGLAYDCEHAQRICTALRARGCAWCIVTKTLPDGVRAAQGFLEPLD